METGRSTPRRPLLVAFAALTAVWFALSYPLAGAMPVGAWTVTTSVLYDGWALAMAGIGILLLLRGADRAWTPLVVALAGMAVGDLLWDLSDHGVIGLPNEGPSLMDACYVSGYLALGLTTVLTVRRFDRRRGVAHLLDTLVVAGGVVLAVLPLVLRPYGTLGGRPPLDQLVLGFYPVAGLLLTAAFAVAALTPGQVPQLRALGLACGLCLAGDQVFLDQRLTGGYTGGGWLDWLWLAQYALMALAVTFPARGDAPPAPARPWRHLSLLTCCALTGPLLLLGTELGGGDGGGGTRATYAAGTVVLVALVCARLTLLVAEHARAVDELRATTADHLRLSSDLRHQSRHDPVTGLPNRYDLAERAAATVAASSARHGLVFLDIDDFKTVNDTYGHAAGDLVLAELGLRLRRACRPADTVARLGGDEFAVLLPGSGAEGAVRTARRLLDAVAEPVAIGGRSITLAASAGVTELGGPAGPGPRGDALADADVAMYAAKRAGKNRVLVYTERMRRDVLADVGLATDVTRAVRGGEIRADFQPIVDLSTGRTVALEALARWDDPERGAVSPATFLPVAERRGLVTDLDLLVMEQSLARMPDWRRSSPALRLSVNASAATLACEDLVDLVLGGLARHGLDGSALVVEVTEQSVIADPAQAALRLQELRRHGITIALDDFGTGYSSLSYLQDLPVDVLKLDRSFLARGVVEGAPSPLLRTVVRLGEELGMSVLAEGIETAQQHAALRELGVQRGQGWLFAAAVPAVEVDALLAKTLPRIATQVGGSTA